MAARGILPRWPAEAIMRRSERLGIAVSVVCLGLLYAINFPLPSRQLSLRFLGSDQRLVISSAAQMALLLAFAIALGVDATMRSHPQHSQRSLLYNAAYWPLSAIITVGVLKLLPNISWWVYQIALIVLTGGVLALVIFLQYQAVDEQGQVRRVPRLLLNVLSYTLALFCFALVYDQNLPSLIAAVAVLALSGALALGILCDADAPLWRIWLHASATALAMGEIMIALSYLTLDARIVGSFLLICFYALVGLSQQYLWQRLTRSTVVEYALVTVVGLIGLGLWVS